LLGKKKRYCYDDETYNRIELFMMNVSEYYNRIENSLIRSIYGYLFAVSIADLELSQERFKEEIKDVVSFVKASDNLELFLWMIFDRGMKAYNINYFYRAKKSFEDICYIKDLPENYYYDAGRIMYYLGLSRIKTFDEILKGISDLSKAIQYFSSQKVYKEEVLLAAKEIEKAERKFRKKLLDNSIRMRDTIRGKNKVPIRLLVRRMEAEP